MIAISALPVAALGHWMLAMTVMLAIAVAALLFYEFGHRE